MYCSAENEKNHNINEEIATIMSNISLKEVIWLILQIQIVNNGSIHIEVKESTMYIQWRIISCTNTNRQCNFGPPNIERCYKTNYPQLYITAIIYYSIQFELTHILID